MPVRVWGFESPLGHIQAKAPQTKRLRGFFVEFTQWEDFREIRKLLISKRFIGFDVAVT